MIREIPISDARLSARDIQQVIRVLRSGQIAQGINVQKFEREFAEFIGSSTSVTAVNSGTSALVLGLLSCGVGPGDEVLVPAFSFAATANAVSLCGAEPVFCDINPETFCIEPESISEMVSPRTKGILAVHLYGHPSDMTALRETATLHGLQLYEDAAQAHGAQHRGQNVGSFGEFGAFSFYATKNLSAGEGGAVVSQKSTVSDTTRLLRNQGMRDVYQHEIVGHNMRMSEIHAVIARQNLKKLPSRTTKRRANALRLSEQITGLKLPSENIGDFHVFHQYTVRVPEDRNGFARALLSEFRIRTGIYYPQALPELPPFQHSVKSGSVAESIRASQEVLSLPIHHRLSRGQLDYIASSVNKLVLAGS